MNGIIGVTARMAEIQSRFVSIQAGSIQAGSIQAGSIQAGSIQAGAPAAVKAASGPRFTTGTTSTTGSTFATALANAVKAVGTGTTGAAAADKTYKLNSKGIPTELAAYGNGKIPANALEKVGGTGHQLWAPAAESLTRLIAEARKDGVKIGINDSYRSYSDQVDVARRKGLYSQGGLAARPGTSEHGWGMAADLDLNNKAQAWMRDNGEKYGFVENVPREPWHWAYKVKT